MTAESPRRKARQLVLQALYASDVQELSPDTISCDVIADEDLPERQVTFARDLFSLVLANQDWADEQIRLLSHNWNIERLADIDRCILRLALVEMTRVPDSPVRVVINEAIELAKLYSTASSSAFINGLLDSFARANNLTAA